MSKQLYRSEKDNVISGVCGGIGKYLSIDPTLIRVLWVLLTLSEFGIGVFAYIVCAIIIPSKSDVVTTNSEGYDSQNFDSTYESTSDSPKSKRHSNGSYSLGIVLIAIGAVLILKRFYSWINFDYLWPVLFIIAGLIIIFKRNR
ncbi:PspC domain-containing protein [Sporosalibacterium faouarense]|uniref:PspC domain-containing protein n=1 Tax=Sporosalibacterium faouarense TaxID=516123 RepID=UPI00192AD237